MNKIKKLTLLIISGVSALFPLLYFWPSIYEEVETQLYSIEVMIGLAFAVISTSMVHSSQLFIPWDDFIEKRYKVKRFESDPWKFRCSEYRGAQIDCVIHYVVTVIYLVIAISQLRVMFPAFFVSILLFGYNGVIGSLFFIRCNKMSDDMRIYFASEQRWQCVRNEVVKFCSEVIEPGNDDFYTIANLRQQLPLDIEQHIICDFNEHIPEFDFMSFDDQDILTDHALNIAMKKGFKPKINSGNPEPLDGPKTVTIGPLKI